MHKTRILTGLAIIAAAFLFAFISAGSGEVKNDGGSATGGIQFVQSGWNETLALAKKENKLIFLDAYASWCGPCRMLKRNTFPDKTAGDFFNSHFINIAIDMEKGEGPALSRKYRVSAYPTLLIIDANGNPVTYTQGYISPQELIEFGTYGLTKSGK